jgi:hypothetical protein
MARWFVNPKRKRKTKGKRRGGSIQHRPRVRLSGHTFLLGERSPYKRKFRRVNPIIHNPFIREVGMFGNPRRRHHRRHHYRHNPIIRNPGLTGGMMGAFTHPMTYISTGFIGTVSAYLTIALPNMLGLFPGTDLMSKVLRGVTRGAAAGLVYSMMKSIAPRQANAALVGGMIGAGGSFIFDFLGTRLIVGAGDTTQTPGMLLAGVGNIFGSAPATAGYGAYTRPMGAYTRPMGLLHGRGMGGVYGPGSHQGTVSGANIYN